MKYEGMVYRPPSEAFSLILQATVGCSHNKCTFCTMYKDDTFHLVPEEDLFRQLEEEATIRPNHKRFFIADGDALCLSTDKLLRLCDKIRKLWPKGERITSYATARDINRKSEEELVRLKQAGLKMVYIGMESGSDKILEAIRKDHRCEDYRQAMKKLKKAGISASVTFISGIGGKEMSEEHAEASAKLVSETNPEYLSFLTLYLEPGAPILKDIREGRLTLLSPEEVLDELKYFFQCYDGEGPTVFRSNHASNYAPLGGDLPEDKEALIQTIEEVQRRHAYRSEYGRSI